VRKRWGGVLLVLLAIVAGGALLLVATPIGRYLLRAGYHEARILARRQSIEQLAASPATPPATRAKLQLVLAARRFAVDSLALPAKDAFTQFTQLDRDTLVLVLSGAYRDALRPVTWWFPIVGRVPYKGFFDFAEAQRAEQAMAAEGYDTYLRPSPAFSTLGFFNDPLLSTTLASDSLEIVNTVIHELTHNRFYAKGQAVFNESFANYVGSRGAERFFLARGDSASARRVAGRWRDDLRLGLVWQRMYATLDSAFTVLPGDSARAARLVARDSVQARTRRLLVDSIASQLETIDPRYAARVRLDNAALLARRIYATGLDDLEALHRQDGGDVRATLAHVIRLAQASPSDPFGALRRAARAP
jgi:predicted aminopeptidase